MPELKINAEKADTLQDFRAQQCFGDLEALKKVSGQSFTHFAKAGHSHTTIADGRVVLVVVQQSQLVAFVFKRQRHKLSSGKKQET